MSLPDWAQEQTDLVRTDQLCRHEAGLAADLAYRTFAGEDVPSTLTNSDASSPTGVRCYSCHGSGCPDCGGTGWLSGTEEVSK